MKLNVYHHELRPNEYAEFYLKYEADKVIAELEDKALQYKVLDKEHCRDLNTQEKFFAKQIARHKYKRCLAMANYWVAVSYQCVDDKHRQRSERHHRKWLELAEKFKEAK